MTGIENLFCEDGLCVPPTEPWQCAGRLPPFPIAPSRTLEVLPLDLNGRPLVGARVRLCPATQLGCEDPLFDEAIGEQGAPLRISLSGVTSGTTYLRSTAEGFLETLLTVTDVERFLGEEQPTPMRMLGEREIATIVTLLGLDYDPERSIMTGRIEACPDQDAAGIEMRVVDGRGDEQVLYSAETLPDPTLDASVAGGTFFFPSVGPGFVRLQGYQAGTDRLTHEERVICIAGGLCSLSPSLLRRVDE